MKILIITKDKKEEEAGKDIKHYNTFFYDKNVLSLYGSCWRKEVEDPEEVFNSINAFFYGTSYHIVDFVFS